MTHLFSSGTLDLIFVDNYFISTVISVQRLFSWRPGKYMTNPQPCFFSFKSIIQNPKMKVRILYLPS